MVAAMRYTMPKTRLLLLGLLPELLLYKLPQYPDYIYSNSSGQWGQLYDPLAQQVSHCRNNDPVYGCQIGTKCPVLHAK
jgi:hypothetical protein